MKTEGIKATRQQGNKGLSPLPSCLIASLPRHRTSNFELRSFGFTLVEMVIVVAVILLVLGIVLPAASTLWKQRRISEAQDTISGLLMTTRAEAMENDFGDSGLFFYLDDAGVQRIAAVNQDAMKAANPDTRQAWTNVFNVRPERTYALPVPMRVVPRYAVCDNEDGKSTCHPDQSGPDPNFVQFSPEELENSDFNASPTAPLRDHAQRHRNFFTMIYSSNGQLRVRRDVLIRDADAEDDALELGDITGLQVADDITNFYRRDPTAGTKEPIVFTLGLTAEELKLVDVVVDPQDASTAINFPSVDGLLVYDESLFGAAGDAVQKRKYLIDSSQPFYVHRLTGAVVRGPVGENEAPTTP